MSPKEAARMVLEEEYWEEENAEKEEE